MITVTNDYNQTMERMTVTMPSHVFVFLKNKVKPGQISDYVARAVSGQIARDLVAQSTDPWDRFFEAYKKVTKKNNISIEDAINRGRA